MIRIMIKYSIKQEKLASFSRAIENFVSEVQKKEGGISEYNVFQGPDGLSFVHYVTFPDQEIQLKHVKASHTKKFNKILKKSVVENPVYIPLNETGQASTFIPDTAKEEAQVSTDSSLYRNERELQQLR